MNIEDLFNKIKIVSKKHNLNNNKFDGRAFWQPIKKILSTSNFKANKWKKIPSKYVKERMDMNEYYINGYGNTEIIKLNHFIIQTVRIPTTEKPSLKKIMQIALNIGQYYGMKKGGRSMINRNNINDFISRKDSNTKLLSILSESEIKKLNDYLIK